MKNRSVLNLIEQGYYKKGDCFSINVFGMQRITFMVGHEAQSAMFQANDKQLSQREVYKFTIPVFGKNIVYDAPYSRMYEQLKFLRHGVGSDAMKSHCIKIVEEVENYFAIHFNSDEGVINLYNVMSDLIINTASRCLLGEEIRDACVNSNESVGELYQQLSDGMKHISFLFPNLPTQFHKDRDIARSKMIKIFKIGITKRLKLLDDIKKGIVDEQYTPSDFLQGLITSKYKDGSNPTIDEICGLLIAMLFAGQHTSNITATWTGYRILLAWNNNNLGTKF